MACLYPVWVRFNPRYGPAMYREALIAENAKLAALVAEADHATPVPTCPGWDLTKLLRHVGRGHRWAATMIETRATRGLDPREVPGGKPPADLDGTVSWLRDSAAALPAAVDAVGSDSPVWTFTGPQPAEWWIRRRLHEETVHRADALLALGREVDLDPELAADGLSEWLDLLVARGDISADLHLHATDVEGEWTIRPDGDGLAWEPGGGARGTDHQHGHGKAAAAVRGPAAQLFLAIVRRMPLDGLEVFGERKAVEDFLADTPF
jgi:uncharacterized protein (TIGR03083 family)